MPPPVRLGLTPTTAAEAAPAAPVQGIDLAALLQPSPEEQALRAQLGGPGAGPALAQVGGGAPAGPFGLAPTPEESAAFIRGVRGEPTLEEQIFGAQVGQAPPPTPGRAGVVGMLQRPRPSAEAPVESRLLREREEGRQAAEAAQIREIFDVAPNAPAALPGEAFVDAQGNTVFVGGEGAPPQPGELGAPPRERPRRPAAPVEPPPPLTEEQLNEQLLDVLEAPREGPLVPFDVRAVTAGEQQLINLADRERFERAKSDAAAVRAADTRDREALIEEQEAALAGRRQAALDSARRRFERALEVAAQQRIEPERFFRSRGLLGQIGAAIAMAMGSVGQALGGGPNQAARIIEAAVNRDVEAQRINLTSAREGAEAQRGVLQLMRQEFEDQEAALEASRAAMLREAARRAEIEGAQATSEDQRLRAIETRTALQAAADEAEATATRREALSQLEFRRNIAETVGSEAEARQELAAAERAEQRLRARPGPGRVSQERLAIFDRLRARGVEETRAQQLAGIPAIPDVPGGPAEEVDPDDLRRFGDRMRLFVTADASLRELESAVATAGEDLPGVGLVAGQLPDLLVGVSGRRLRRRMAAVVGEVLHANAGTAVTEQEAERLTRALGLVQGATETEIREGLEELRRRHGAGVGTVQASFGGVEGPVVRAFERAGGFSGLRSDVARGAPSLRRRP